MSVSTIFNIIVFLLKIERLIYCYVQFNICDLSNCSEFIDPLQLCHYYSLVFELETVERRRCDAVSPVTASQREYKRQTNAITVTHRCNISYRTRSLRVLFSRGYCSRLTAVKAISKTKDMRWYRLRVSLQTEGEQITQHLLF